ncbi:MAG: Hsp33 family molecular chaperone HslO [Clostridiaceae bacterium]
MDKIVYATAHNKEIRIIATIDTELVSEAQNTHKTLPVASASLGRLLTAGALMGAMLKSEKESLTIKIDGRGPLRSALVTAHATDDGISVKGYVGNPKLDLPLKENGKLDVGSAIGIDGEVMIIKDLGLKEPYIGKTPIVTGEIGDDLAYYFTTSEQTPSAVGLGVLVNPDLSIKASGGFIIQMLPGADPLVADIISYRLEEIKSITEFISEGYSIYDILNEIFGDMDLEILEEKEVSYKCDCSRERVEKALISIGKNDLNEIYEDGKEEELVCHFCNKKYKFTNEDIGNILKEI